MNPVKGLPLFCERLGKPAAFLLSLVLFTAFSLMALEPLLIIPDWPQNHEQNAFALRTRVYAEHFWMHDAAPLWSSTDNNGFGSPMPSLYHKLYYYISGALFRAVPDMKLALTLPIFLFMVTGAFGMTALLRELGAARLTCMAGGICLIAAKYTVTNWLIRGAVAELSAAMLIPWALCYFLRAIKENRVPAGLAVTLALIFLGHSVIGYYLGLLFGMFFAGSLLLGKIKPTRRFLGSAAAAALLFAVLAAPNALLIATIGRDYDMQRILTPPYQPFFQFPPLFRYFWDVYYFFGYNWNGYTVQLDTPPLILALGGFGTLLWGRNLQAGPEERRELAAPLLPLATLGLIAFFLQTPLSVFFYRHVPGAAYIQFPWRLLGVLTPVVIAIGLYFAEKGDQLWGKRGGVVLCTFAMVYLCGSFTPIIYGSLPKERNLNAPLERICFSLYDEYKPKTVPIPAPSREAVLAEAAAKGCKVRFTVSARETRQSTFTVDSAEATTLPLPLFVSPMHVVKVFDENGKLLQQSAPDSGLCHVKVPHGKSKVIIEMPDISKFIRWQWKVLLGGQATG